MTMPYLRLNEPSVVHEAIDGEVVIVHLDKGLYFSADDTAAWVWGQAVNGVAWEAIAATFADTYADHSEAQTACTAFLSEAVDHELLVPSAESAPPAELLEITPPQNYSAPELVVFSEMAELLLLDPIHEVEQDKGWPNTSA